MAAFFARATKGWKAARHNTSGALFNVCDTQTGVDAEDAQYVLSCCDGRHDFASPAFLPRHRAALGQLMRMGAAMRCPRGFSGDKPAIEGALWAVTGRCNMKCRHCYMGAPEGQSELSFEAMERIVNALCEGGATSVELTGGEPFMRDDLFKLIGLLGENGIEVTDIFTNATLIRDETIARIAEAGIKPCFHVSFDGVGAHDTMRGVPGAEKRAMRGMRRLIEAGHTVFATTSVERNTLPSLPATYDAMRSLGVHAWGLGRPMSVGCAKNMVRLDDASFARACEEILRLWQSEGKPFTLGLEAFYSETISDGARRETPPFHPGLYACENCRVYPHITHKGELMPCPCYADTEYGGRFGNLVRDGWIAAWQNPTLRRVMDITKAEVLAVNPECADCEYLAECRTGCRVSALLAGNGLTGQDEIVCGLFRSGIKTRFSAMGGGQLE
ncbi:MAG: radical SAM protein [Eubacteriales bacterium]|nr:radical SAM protein [Eubacteriales bacterium]